MLDKESKVLKDEDVEIISELIVKGTPRNLGLIKEYNENVKKSLRVVPIVNSLVSLEMLRELRAIRSLLEENSSDKPARKLKKEK